MNKTNKVLNIISIVLSLCAIIISILSIYFKQYYLKNEYNQMKNRNIQIHHIYERLNE